MKNKKKFIINEFFMENQYVETKITTKFGKFNIRVYRDSPGKETIVLFTNKINRSEPTFVRIHSECITGDLLRSLHCDCGQQLIKSLELINENGGVLIYLRQEGRGIGLFEKIKTYQLQKKGHDTFEANVILGHDPDERTYEMVKIVLADLKIQKIKLLTNNPSKVSEVAKLEIDVQERIPLVVRSNKYSKNYLETKRNKFQHIFNSKINNYFYGFHAEIPLHVEEIAKFIKNKIKDPLLKICVGIAADNSVLSDKKEIERIKSIFEICKHFDVFVPVLHFTFGNSIDLLNDLKTIKNVMPFVERLQTNDLPSFDMHFLKIACSLFSIDFPFSDKNFDYIHNAQFRNLLKNNNSFILLDNSKGKGIKESKNSLQKKIDILLNYGLNNIVICGGFGPNDLENYFSLKRYYKINFSIDAESKLKTDDKIDLEKIKLYLLQLIRFDDPKLDAINQTRLFLKQHRRSKWESVILENKKFMVHPDVFHPGYFPSSLWFTKELQKQIKNKTSFCEVGCGSGVITCLLALSNPKIHILATDINPYAKENTILNAKQLGISDRVEVKVGDILDSVAKEKHFDFIFWALPFGFLDPGIDMTFEDLQVFDPGYKSIRKFFKTAKKHLKSDGKLLIGFSSDLGHFDLLKFFADENNIKLKKIAEKEMQETNKIKFELLIGRYS
ncbi:MAG: GTP cyclohydrolase II [Bacteroidales bacterium]|nr:GTP cyclohydrolase II [Bacteroidales bacterium]